MVSTGMSTNHRSLRAVIEGPVADQVYHDLTIELIVPLLKSHWDLQAFQVYSASAVSLPFPHVVKTDFDFMAQHSTVQSMTGSITSMFPSKHSRTSWVGIQQARLSISELHAVPQDEHMAVLSYIATLTQSINLLSFLWTQIGSRWTYTQVNKHFFQHQLWMFFLCYLQDSNFY